MDPNLVCKIVTTTVVGKSYRGTGYPITPNRIITAAHVIDDAALTEEAAPDTDVRQIRIFFGVEEKEVEGPVAIEWSGMAVGVDVAVLRCELEAAWQPGHELLTEPPKALIEWYARGYTEYGKSGRVGGKDAYYGKLAPFADDEPVVALGCHEGLVSSQQWAGGSGSVAFLNASTVRQALAVITDYQGGKKQDQLLAVPLNYLLNSDTTREGFRQAIQFEAYLHRESYRDQCVEIMTALLDELQEDIANQIATDIIEDFSNGQDIGIDIGGSKCAQQTAAYLVNHLDIMEAVGYLSYLRERAEGHEIEVIHKMIDHLLSLNYAPSIVRRLQAQVAHNQFGFVENEIATRTAAEIIMAGYDQKPAQFVVFSEDDDRPQGRPALNVHAAPEQGLGDLGSDTSLLLAVRSDLIELLNEKDRILGLPGHARRKPVAEPADDEMLALEVQTYATQLRGALNAFKRGVHRGRRMYCVLTLPQEPAQRDFRKKVLRKICGYIPDLVFIELIANPTDARDYEVETYVQMRFIH